MQTLAPHHLAHCEYELNDQGFKAPNRAILAAVIMSNEYLVDQLNLYYTDPKAKGGLDTAEREHLLDALVWFYLGKHRHWPCNNDGQDTMVRFVNDLTKAVGLAGWNC